MTAKELGERSAAGLTKREYFAGLAMQGMLANPDVWKKASQKCKDPGARVNSFAYSAVKAVDGLLAELAKQANE